MENTNIVKNALILAVCNDTTNQNTAKDIPWAMAKIYGVPVLERLLYNLNEVGISKVVIVIDDKGGSIIDYFGNVWSKVEIVYRRLEKWNGTIPVAVSMGEDIINERFVLARGDTIFKPQEIKRFLEIPGDLVIGIGNKSIDVPDTTLVLEGNRISHVGGMKERNVCNRKLITDIAVCDPLFFRAIRYGLDKGMSSTHAIIQWMVEHEFDVRVIDMTGKLCWKVDSQAAFERTSKEIFERAWRERLGPSEINLFKRVFNLPISLPLTKLASKTSLKPYHLTLICLVFALSACILFVSGLFGLGGIFSFACAMIDAVDGKISRLKLLCSKTGSFFDSVVDRTSEILIVGGLSYGVYVQTSNTSIFLVGCFAVLGWLGRFYLKELFIDKFGIGIWKETKTLAFEIVGHRDFCFFITMISCIAGYTVLPLFWMAIFGNLLSILNLLKYFKIIKN